MGWRVTVNGFGFGEARANVQSAGGTAQAFNREFGPSAAIPAAPNFNAGSALPPGANPATFVRCEGGGFWSITASTVSANGDVTGSEARGPAGGALVSTQLQFGGARVSATTAIYSLQWSGSGKGASQSLQWLETAEPFCPVFDHGQILLPEGVLDGARVLHVEERSGKFSESLQIPIEARHDVNNIVVISRGDAVSSARRRKGY